MGLGRGEGSDEAREEARRAPLLVACAHGTRNDAGRRAITRLVEAVARRAPEVVAAYVDVQTPTPEAALAAAPGRAAVLVPLLLSRGYHVEVDLARAARDARAPTVVAAPLGPDDLLLPPLRRRLADALGAAGQEAQVVPYEDTDVLLVAAGSSRAAGAQDVAIMAQRFGAALGRRVEAAYLAAGTPRLGDLVAAGRAAGRRAVAVSFLLAPGHFQDRLAAAGADVATPPLLDPDAEPATELVDLVLRRYAAGRDRLDRLGRPGRA